MVFIKFYLDIEFMSIILCITFIVINKYMVFKANQAFDQ